MQQEEPNKYVKELTQEKYKYGFGCYGWCLWVVLA